ncbi:hypothetical protein P775_17380 [Puniceibacterium antarcticum]|uniref:Aminoglycoside phosphotransferase domain-containing protein n=1 Tax=Puniceibacterium antarcticum TaxID=1206336 RepID=A0A2G8RB65_9RHOB|nr:fructosamine kinase family protein [Puniceibacterium antarcticum]PIL18815.1 hypothetical protein P775_17380 [Puniceibacterium antarcticum]
MSFSDTLTAALGADVATTTPLQGGDLSQIELVTLTDGRQMVAKRGPLVEVEGRVLAALQLLRAPVPAVLHLEQGLLCLQYLSPAPPSRQGWRDLGKALAQLHSHDGAGYGWQEDYALGRVEIRNSTTPDWPTFWAERRLLADISELPGDLAARVETLARRLPDLLPKEPRAAPLHGDLWIGNLHFSEDGAYLIDPACYHGHSEVDLAMLTLFGQPDDAFWRSYGTLDHGFDDRKPIYQLWPALVHLRLFGESYRPMVSGLLHSLAV